MGNAIYATLTRQTGLMREMSSLAQNVANLSTPGYRAERTTFSEHIVDTGRGADSLSMARAGARWADMSPAALRETGAPLDFAIEGQGFFTVEGEEGPLLTRAGSFTPNARGELVTPEGRRLLDAGGAPVFVPPDAGSVRMAGDGTLSAGDRPVARIGLVSPADPTGLERRGAAAFSAPDGTVPEPTGRIMQGFLEGSNVAPVAEMARLVEVQRAYEMGQGFLDREDQRLERVIRTLGPQSG